MTNTATYKFDECNYKQKYLFISYSRKDSDIVYPDVERFQNLGYNIFIDLEGIYGTDEDWDEEVLRTIYKPNCALILAYVSDNSLLSDPCFKELFAADSKDARKHRVSEAKKNGKAVPIKFIDVRGAASDNNRLIDEHQNLLREKLNVLSGDEYDLVDKKISVLDKMKGRGRQLSKEFVGDEKYYQDLKKIIDKKGVFCDSEKRKGSNQKQVPFSDSVFVASSESQTTSTLIPQSVINQPNEIVQESVSEQPSESVQTAKEEKKAEFSKVLNKSQKSVADSSGNFIADVWANASSHDLVEQWGLEARKPQKDFVNVVSKILKDKKFSHYFDWQVSGSSLANSLRDSSSQKKLGAAISEHEDEIIAKIKERVSEEFVDSEVNSLLDKAKPAIQIRTTSLNKNADAEQVALWFLKATDIMMSVISEYY